MDIASLSYLEINKYDGRLNNIHSAEMHKEQVIREYIKSLRKCLHGSGLRIDKWHLISLWADKCKISKIGHIKFGKGGMVWLEGSNNHTEFFCSVKDPSALPALEAHILTRLKKIEAGLTAAIGKLSKRLENA